MQLNRALRNTTIRQRLAIAALAVCGAGAAHAGDMDYSINVSDKDFKSGATVVALHQRIRRTARSVCPSYFVSRGLAESARCRREVEADLVARIAHPALTAYVRGGEQLQVAERALAGSEVDPS
ncbi:MAG: UrcA family protein [Pseudomonadota bacterium]